MNVRNAMDLKLSAAHMPHAHDSARKWRMQFWKSKKELRLAATPSAIAQRDASKRKT